ncbi:putative inorganic phosphate cotransporter isoform X1 [Coccinella septempunctata]|uniref:putative inorganic phosphate cotransporter isoform X1 n=2 Tax=Coccinella septempunctata TaxID=41139 RepID=UPI001D05CD29|nr:putative inorganic phosphate cotransporter isoform X1 [Coccinella septempunctata]
MDVKDTSEAKMSSFSKMGARHVQIFLLFAAGFIGYGMRASMSVGIVAMISEKPPDESIPTYPELKDDKDTILSSFFWGYVVFQIGAGQIAEKYGPKYFLMASLAIASCFSALIPYMVAQYGSTGLMVNRVIQGLCQGFLFPSTHCVLSKWTPLAERSRIAGFVYTAGPLGTSVSMIVTGFISDTSFGWPYVFYLYGCCGLLWVLIYTYCGCNKPSEHKTISIEERNYIEENTMAVTDEKVRLKTPWTSILSSLPFWAILVSHVGNNWGFWTLLTEIPSFMSSVLKYDIKSNSELSALPYLGYCILGLVLSPASDLVIGKKILSLGGSRKLFNCVGLILPAISLIALGYLPTGHETIAVILLVLAVSTNAGVLVGFNVNHIDISPNFAGTLMGLTNCAANFGSFIGPLLVKYIVTDPEDEFLWRIVFMISAGLYIASAIFFVIFGSGERQDWNEPKNEVGAANNGIELIKPKLGA